MENNKLLDIFYSSKLYNFARKIYLILLVAFRETFFYKMFFSPMNTEISDHSFMYKIIIFLRKIIMAAENKIAKIMKRDRTKNNTIVGEIAESSVILKFFLLDDYKGSFVFLIFLALMFFVGLIPTMAVLGLCLFIIVFSIFDRDFSKRLQESKILVTDTFIIFYLVALFYSRCISNDIQKNKIFLVYFVFVGFYFAIRYYISDEERLFNSINAFASSAIFVCLTGAAQFITGSYKTSLWTDHNTFSDIQGRLVATFENPNVFGEYLLLIIPIAIAMFFVSKSKTWKWIYGLLIASAMVCMILTYSRGCWLGLIFSLVVFILLMFPKLVLPTCIIAPFSIFVMPESVLTRLTSIGSMHDSSTVFRVYIWRGTIDMLKRYWMSGIGLGTDCYEKYYSRYAYDAVLAPHSHNTFLHVMCESGFFGFLVFVLLMYFVFRQLFIAYSNTKNKNLKIVSTAFASAFAGLLVQGMFDNLFYNYRLYMIFFAAVGISCAIYETYLKERDKL